MKRFLIVIVTVVCLVLAAATAACALRVPSTRDGDPDEVQHAKRHDEPSTGSRLILSQGRLTEKGLHRSEKARVRRPRVNVRFPGKKFFLEK